MSWQGIVGHDDVVEQFRRRLAADRVQGTFLFVGPAGIGKQTFARKLSQALLCRGGTHRTLDPCGGCEDCKLCEAGTHPDLLAVAKPPDRSELPLRLLIGEGEHRMREGLCYEIGLKPFRGGRRVAIIDDADDLNVEGANCLLKTLEEPPPRSVMILISTSPDRQLPTIRSRSQIVRFHPPAAADAAALIVREGWAADEAAARRLAEASGGSLDEARRLAEPAFADFRRRWLEQLARSWHPPTAAAALLAFVDDAGKDAGRRRDRLRWALGLTADFYRGVLRAATIGEVGADDELRRAAEAAAGDTASDPESLVDVVERCLEAIEQVDRNANPTTLVEALCDDVGRRLPV